MDEKKETEIDGGLRYSEEREIGRELQTERDGERERRRERK
jgi:hypothetical protein